MNTPVVNAVAPEEKRRVLKERAKALARRASRVERDEADLEVVEFLLSHERYALEYTHIREVCPLKDLTPLPGTPDFVLGIINMRGEILSVIDLKRVFDLPGEGLTDLNQVIVLRSEEMEFGILADEILGPGSIPAGSFQTSLPTLTGIRAEYLKGVTPEGVVILDGAKILSDRNLLIG